MTDTADPVRDIAPAGHQWLPPRHVRVLAVGIVRRGDDLLLMEVHDGAGAVKGWRPLGGAVEFGERAAEALVREFREEIARAVTVGGRLAVLENIFEHGGAPGHEVVMVFEAAFEDAASYDVPEFRYRDGGLECAAAWVSHSDLRKGRATLYPAGLLDALDRNAGAP